ncbi:MAG: hypothetical protein KAW12_13460 [Candidatus Aminicenantes bacterium]|nr:hypothetical protein [Candidatus Aminicenantes bacterium]
MIEKIGQASVIRKTLTGLSREITNAQYIADRVFPVVGNIDNPLLEIEIFDNDLGVLSGTLRAIRGDSNQMTPGGSQSVFAKIPEHDLYWPVDYYEKIAAIRNLENRALIKTKGGLDLLKEKTAADLTQNPDTYPADHVVTLSGSSVWTDAVSTPVEDIEAGKDKIGDKIVQDPNTLVLANNTYKTLKFHPQLKAMLSDDQKKIVSLDDMKQIFDVPNIIIGKAVYRDPATGANKRLWQNCAILLYLDENPSPEARDGSSLSFGYNFRLKQYPFVDEFYLNPGKVKAIRNNDAYLLFVAGSEAGYLIRY